MDKLGSRSMIFLILGRNNKQLEYEGMREESSDIENGADFKIE